MLNFFLLEKLNILEYAQVLVVLGVELDCVEGLLSPDPSLMGMKQPNKQTDV